MDELLARHKKEARDLQSRMTQKKKGASKKTRKGVNDECEKLERELKGRHEQEIAVLNGESDDDNQDALPDDSKLNGTANGSKDEEERVESTAKQLEHLNVNPSPSQSEQTAETGQRKPNRQKARLARRAAEQEALAEQAAAEAADLPNLKEQERQRMLESFKKNSLTEKEIRADGHCLYSAIADQLHVIGMGLQPRITPSIADESEAKDQPPYKIVRKAAADYIESHGEDFVPFLEEPLPSYVHKVKDTGEWGGQLELLALAKTYGVDINVLQGDGNVTKIEGTEGDADKNIWLAYYRHGFGLGEHYNSLRKAP